MREGSVRIPMPWNAETPVTRALVEDGRRHALLGGPIAVGCPVRIVQGQADAQVPWDIALRIAAAISGPDVRVTLMKDGEHRLSRPSDLAELCAAFDALSEAVRAQAAFFVASSVTVANTSGG